MIRSSCIAVLIFALLILCFPVSAQQSSMQDTDTRERGIKLYESGDLTGAIKVLRQAVKKDKSDGVAWYYLGVALYRSDKNKDARKALESAVKLRPSDGSARSALAYTLLVAGKLDDALREAMYAITLDDRNAAAYYVLGVVRLRNGELLEARMAADKALDIEPNMPFALLLESQVLVNMLSYVRMTPDVKPFPDPQLDNKDYLLLKEAAEYLEKFLKLKPDSKNAEELSEQLETLRFYANLAVDQKPSGESSVFKSEDLTTKARILKKPSPSYSKDALAAQVTGTVVLQMVLASDGKVKHILVLRWLSHGLVFEAAKVARQIKFVPATKNGQNVSQIVRVEYNFHIY